MTSTSRSRSPTRSASCTKARSSSGIRAYDLYHRPRTRFVADFVGQGVFLRGVATGRGRVVTELGELATQMPLIAPDGEAVDLLVRPDDIVHDDDSPWKAEVAAKAFRGADFVYTLKLASGTRVLSLVPSHHDHAIGERIGIRLAIDHVVAFPAAAAVGCAPDSSCTICARACSIAFESVGRTSRAASLPARRKTSVGQSLTPNERPSRRPLPSSILM